MIRPFGIGEFWFIASATIWTLALTAIAFGGGTVGGFLVAMGRVSPYAWLRWVMAAIIRIFQGTPLLMQLFLAYFGAAMMGFNVSPWTAAAIGLTAHASAFLGEIWRGCIQAVPSGQWEASTALGLNYWTKMRYVVLPQAFKISLAPSVGFLVHLLKGTSLAAIIGFVELTRAGQIINNVTFQPFKVFITVAGIYFLLCWPLSLLASRLERKQAKGR